MHRVFPRAIAIVALTIATTVNTLHAAAGLNGLSEVDLFALSQQDQSLLGAKALTIHPQGWKHAETPHFIYHYERSFVATPVSVEAEFYFRVATNELAKENVPWPAKAHIYIFEQPEDWESFQTAGALEKWTGAIQSGGSLFIVRNPAYKFSDNSLGHEITNLVLHRLYGTGVPLWLNEGFAQFASKSAHASYQRARGYLAKPSSQAAAAGNFFPLATLTTMRSYPAEENVENFYNESERLVRFLMATDRAKFVEFFDAVAKGGSFDRALAAARSGRDFLVWLRWRRNSGRTQWERAVAERIGDTTGYSFVLRRDTLSSRSDSLASPF